MSASKRPSTSSLRRYLTSRPYISVADIRRRFGLELEPDAMSRISRNGTCAYIGLPDREAAKLEDLWRDDEVGVELSVEVNAPVVVGVYPMRLARFVTEPHTFHSSNGHAPNGHAPNGHAPHGHGPNGHVVKGSSGPHLHGTGERQGGGLAPSPSTPELPGGDTARR